MNHFLGKIIITRFAAVTQTFSVSTKTFRYKTESWIPLFIAVMDEVSAEVTPTASLLAALWIFGDRCFHRVYTDL